MSKYLRFVIMFITGLFLPVGILAIAAGVPLRFDITKFGAVDNVKAIDYSGLRAEVKAGKIIINK